MQQRHDDPEADERLSALIDGELDALEIGPSQGRLLKDGAERWREYALIGDALRGNALRTARFMDRMHDALAEEPTLLAPIPTKKTDIPQPAYWLAAAAAITAITWTVLSAAPDTPAAMPIAAAPQSGAQSGLRHAAQPGQPLADIDVNSYLAAHQDYAHAVVSPTDMRFTTVSLVEAGQ